MRTDLKGNCEIKISFLEIYKENVTDLLEGYVSTNGATKQNSKPSSPVGARRDGHNRDRSSSFIIHPNLASQDGSSVAASQRTKSKTFYVEQDKLEESINKKRSKFHKEGGGGISPPKNLQDASNTGRKSSAVQKFNLSFRGIENKLQYKVKENAVKGVYVDNLSEVVCLSAEQAYNCLLNGLMRKRMS